jgi:hypothetical protein
MFLLHKAADRRAAPIWSQPAQSGQSFTTNVAPERTVLLLLALLVGVQTRLTLAERNVEVITC